MSGPLASRPPEPDGVELAPAQGAVARAAEGAGGKLERFHAIPVDLPIPPSEWVEVVKAPFRLLKSVLFVVTVLIPTVASVLYFGWFASDVYISESRFVVRAPQRTQQTGVLGALLQGNGFQRAQDDSFTVHDFMTSRDALSELDNKLGVRAAFSDKRLDLFSRFPLPWMDDSAESLFKYYLKRVSVVHDSATSITTLTVRAFTPNEAHDINAMLLSMGEELINKINERGRRDLVKYSMAEVAEAEAKARAAALALANYRNRRAVFDPDRQSALQLQQVTKLQDELIATKLQLAQIKSLSPANPQIPTLERRVRGLEGEMATEMGKVAGGGNNSFTDKAAEFERLQLERSFAERQVASAMTSLEAARSEARRQTLYLERIVQPNTPDEALEPRRLRSMLATFVVGLVAWGVLSMLVAGIREHRD